MSTEHENPADVQEGEIVGLPTMLAKYAGRQDANRILESLKQIGYPLDDVSVLFRLEGSDQVLDQLTGQVAAGQALTDKDLHSPKVEHGQTVVLMHPYREQLQAVEAVLQSIGPVEIEYTGETHAFGRLGGVERKEEETT